MAGGMERLEHCESNSQGQSGIQAECCGLIRLLGRGARDDDDDDDDEIFDFACPSMFSDY